MDIGIVSMRYAKALIEYAKEKHTEDVLYKEMKMLSKSLSAVPRLREALANPVLNIREKYSLICTAATGDKNVSREFSRFITLVLKNNREQFLQFICLSFLDLYRKLKHRGTTLKQSIIGILDRLHPKKIVHPVNCAPATFK